MSFSNRLTRLPRPFDADLGAEAAALVPGLGAREAELIAGAASASPFLKSLVEREAEWLSGALHDPEAALATELHDAGSVSDTELSQALRKAKRRIALLTGLADLGGVWSLDTVMRVLSEFAGQAAEWAARAELGKQARRGKLPNVITEDLAGFSGFVVLAMGKMGAYELNYSSDIDLICLFDDRLYDNGDVLVARQALVKVTRAMTQLLSERTGDGYVFRTDLRLRPDPSVTPVCLSMAAAEQYYESFGRTWERAAMIKARPAAGDLAAGQRFLEDIRPFIWRRHLDFATIEDAHTIRRRIRETKRLHGPLVAAGHDMKLGQGGIRDIEFFTQTRQLIAGGRDPGLRMRGTEESLGALAEKGWLSRDVAASLVDHYRAFREIEHRIQMVNDAQTHKMPAAKEGLERVACLMGLSVEDMLQQVGRRLSEVSELTEDFFAPDAARPSAAQDHEFDRGILSRWRQYPALRSDRAAQIFDRLKPELLARLARTEMPNEALLAFDGFLAGLPAGVQLFSLFDANPGLIDLLVDIVGTAPGLAEYLSRNAAVFDAVIGGDFFAPWPGQDLSDNLAAIMAREDDYERRLDAARRWKKEWHFRIGVHHLRGLIDAEDAGAQYADLADAVLRAVWPVVVEEFARRHGMPPGRGAAILGMGSLGARQMNAGSDLDVIVIYDADGVDMSDGRRPLASRMYYARLTQALITAMTAPMSQGRLYEIDMRLRPSGNQGPVATNWSAFQNYQKTEAWLWEHLALTRARVVTGPPDLCAEIERFRAGIIADTHDLGHICTAVAEMRDRLAAAKAPSGVFDIRNGAGRLQDLELVAQAGHLMSGQAKRSAVDGLMDAQAAGWLSPDEASLLIDAHRFYWSLHAAARLVSGERLFADAPGEGAAQFLCRSAGSEDVEALKLRLLEQYERVAATIDAALDRGRGDRDGQD